VDREAETDEVGQDGGGAGLSADGGETGSLGGGGGEVGCTGDWETGGVCVREGVCCGMELRAGVWEGRRRSWRAE